MGRADELRGWAQPSRRGPPTNARLRREMILDPDAMQDLDSGHFAQPRRGVVGIDGGDQVPLITADRLGAVDPRGLARRQPVVLGAVVVTRAPLGGDLRLQPRGSHGGKYIQDVSPRLGDQLYSVEGPYRDRHMSRIGALPPARPQESALLGALQEHVEQQPGRAPSQQARAELAEDSVVGTGIGQLQREGILSVDAPAHGLGGFATGEVLSELEQGDQRQAPGSLGRLPV